MFGGEGGGVGQGEGEEGSRSGARVAGDSSVPSQRVFEDSERFNVINFEIAQAETAASVVTLG